MESAPPPDRRKPQQKQEGQGMTVKVMEKYVAGGREKIIGLSVHADSNGMRMRSDRQNVIYWYRELGMSVSRIGISTRG